MKRKRVSSGIPGYDEMINGGYFQRSVNVVSGESGTGKTLFGAQFLYEGAMKSEKGLFIMTSERAEDLIDAIDSSFGWDFNDLENSGLISFVDIANPELRLQKTVDMAPTELIKGFKNLIDRKLKEDKPDRVFIDSIETLFLAIESQFRLKTLIDDVFYVLRSHDVTSVITVGTTFKVQSTIEFGADSVTRLGRVVSGNNLVRSIYINKVRGSRTINEIRVLNISDDGVRVLDKSPYIT